MIAFLYIDYDQIGTVTFKVIDESMGVIEGELSPTDVYKKYQKQIQELFNKKGIANINDFNFKIILEDKTILEPEGGIGVTDCFSFNEILVESAGLGSEIIKKIIVEK